MLRIFRTVWRLVYGLLTSGNAMLSTFFILLLTLYIYACLGRAYRKTLVEGMDINMQESWRLLDYLNTTRLRTE